MQETGRCRQATAKCRDSGVFASGNLALFEVHLGIYQRTWEMSLRELLGSWWEGVTPSGICYSLASYESIISMAIIDEKNVITK